MPSHDPLNEVGLGAVRAEAWANAGVYAELAELLLATLGPGRTLVIGPGACGLVLALLARGVDARGLLPTPEAAADADRAAPGRFGIGSSSRVPHDDDAFVNAISLDELGLVSSEAVGASIRELSRVARAAMVRPGFEAGAEGAPRGRDAWERRFMELGWRRHRRFLRATPYEALNERPGSPMMCFERIPPAVLARHPLASLRAERDLHMDMFREPGRRADAHAARYMLAALSVRPNDVVLDVSCGLGYGSAVLAANTQASEIIGIDIQESTVAYANDCYAGREPTVRFAVGDAQDLRHIPDESVDVVVSFETLEHVPDPERALAEFRRVLRPSGRVVVSVPNDWTDHTGKDPNPHHLHVYRWENLREQLERGFIVEHAYAQTAGGGMKLTDRPRSIRREPPEAPAGEAEWWLAVAMKSPLEPGATPFRETTFPRVPDAPGYHVTAFGRDYERPAIVRAMVSMGLRSTSQRVLHDLAQRVREISRPGSADTGAAICVLAYQRLAGPPDGPSARSLLGAIEAFDRVCESTPHAQRWRISLRFAAASLLASIGEQDAALASFEACAASDCLVFSPLLATKTVESAFRAGIIHAGAGRVDRALACWRHGAAEAERALRSDWLNVRGDPAHPLTFGLLEASLVADAGAKCARAIELGRWFASRPGLVYEAAATQGIPELRRYADGLERAFREARSRSREDELREWTNELEQARTWLTSRVEELSAELSLRDRAVEELRGWSRELEASKNFNADHAEALEAELEARTKAEAYALEQAGRWQREAEARGRIIAELRSWSEELDRSKAWLSSQQEAGTQAIAERDAEIERLRAWAEELERSKQWHAEQTDAGMRAIAERDAEIERLRAWAEELERSKQWHAEQTDAGTRAIAERDAEIERLRAWAEELERSKRWHAEQTEAAQRDAQAHRAHAEELASWARELQEAVRYHERRSDALAGIVREGASEAPDSGTLPGSSPAPEPTLPPLRGTGSSA